MLSNPFEQPLPLGAEVYAHHAANVSCEIGDQRCRAGLVAGHYWPNDRDLVSLPGGSVTSETARVFCNADFVREFGEAPEKISPVLAECLKVGIKYYWHV